MKDISIIITTNDDNIMLRETLPEIMSQQYDAAFEVVVVRETRQGNVKDILEPLLSQYSNLRTTYLPDKPLYVTDNEIEILLGVKASHYDDIIIIDSSFMPTSDDWLKDVASLLDLNEEYPLLIGNAHYRQRLGFFSRRSHKRRIAKLLKPWCREHALRAKDLFLSNADALLFSIAFRRKDYLGDLSLRHIISSHCDV